MDQKEMTSAAEKSREVRAEGREEGLAVKEHEDLMGEQVQAQASPHSYKKMMY